MFKHVAFISNVRVNYAISIHLWGTYSFFQCKDLGYIYLYIICLNVWHICRIECNRKGWRFCVVYIWFEIFFNLLDQSHRRFSLNNKSLNDQSTDIYFYGAWTKFHVYIIAAYYICYAKYLYTTLCIHYLLVKSINFVIQSGRGKSWNFEHFVYICMLFVHWMCHILSCLYLHQAEKTPSHLYSNKIERVSIDIKFHIHLYTDTTQEKIPIHLVNQHHIANHRQAAASINTQYT